MNSFLAILQSNKKPRPRTMPGVNTGNDFLVQNLILPHVRSLPSPDTHIDNLFHNYSYPFTWRELTLHLPFPHLIKNIIFTGWRCQEKEWLKSMLSLDFRQHKGKMVQIFKIPFAALSCLNLHDD